MLSLIGVPLIAAAWALPALFLLVTGTLIAYVVGRPVFLAWGRGFDRVVGSLARLALRFAESLAVRSYDHAVRHTGRDR